MPFTEQLRNVARESGMTRHELSVAADIHESALSRFMSGVRFLSPAALDRLAGCLGLEVRRRSPREKGE
jgi:transcriptional regulator with XRE-family HTH domain